MSFAPRRFVTCSVCSKPPQKFVQASHAQELQFIGHWPHFCRRSALKAIQRSSSGVPSGKRTLTMIGHQNYWVTQGHSYWCRHDRNSERGLVAMQQCRPNFRHIRRELQILRFQPPHHGLTTVLREKPSNIYE